MADKDALGPIPPGPPKQPPPIPEPVHATTVEKTRSVRFRAQTSAEPEADVHHLANERLRLPRGEELRWDFVGPSNIGGRATCLAVHPSDPEHVYMGTAGGGVWATRNGGHFWRSLWDRYEVHSIGAIAIDGLNPDVIFVGSGEANMTGDNYPGVGVYRSDDAGVTWNLVAPSITAGVPQRIGAIAVNPTDSNHVVLGGISFAGERPGGLYASRDRGVTWTRDTAFGTDPYHCHAVLFHPDGRTLYVSIDNGGVQSGIWRSSDSGASWTRLHEGLPPGRDFDRTSLALCQTQPQFIYALVATPNSKVLGLFRSVNGGDIWSSVGWDHFDGESQMRYNNCIAVHPLQPGFVICGGVDLHRTIDGGKSWTQVTDWKALRGNTGYAHADHHAVAIPLADVTSGRIYSANDGGCDFSPDSGTTWTNRSDSLAAIMFYSVAIAQSDDNFYGGGSQDNGTLATSTGRPDRFLQVLGGDGGFMCYDPNDAEHLFASYERMHIHRHRSGQGWQDVTPKASSSELGPVWLSPIVMDPRCPTTVFTASTRVWRTHNDGDSWVPVSPVFDGSAVTALAVSPLSHVLVFAATQKGGVYRSMDGGNSWSPNIGGRVLAGKLITDLAPSPDSSEVLYLCVGGVSKQQPFAHIYRAGTDNHLVSDVVWEPLGITSLPNVPFNGLDWRDDVKPFLLFAGCDTGVYQSDDMGVTWRCVSSRLPLVRVTDLAYHRRERTLTAATYGRGLWRVEVE